MTSEERIEKVSQLLMADLPTEEEEKELIAKLFSLN